MKDEGKDRRSSKVWQLFTRIGTEGLAKCELCGHILSYKSSTTNLAKHVERKHRGAFQAIGTTEEDPRECLKEFITLENPDTVEEEVKFIVIGEGGEEALRDNDTEWTPPKKMLRKSSTPATKKVKPELISSNGVDYLIYTHEQPPQRTPQPQVLTKVQAMPQRPPISTATTSRTAPPPEEDEFSCFARFLSKRIRALKDPYWQSCAINEINSALHKVEMRRYEPPRNPLGSDLSVQTDPLADHVSHVVSHVDHVEQRIVEEIVEDVVV
uniref:BED-type domain-containing protein n=1 Tax=Lygus hesperus TaxID=30085 RepID=A0A146M5P3_LYGHE